VPGIAQWRSDFSKRHCSFSKFSARTAFVIASLQNRGGFPPVSKEVSSLRVIGVGTANPNMDIEVILKSLSSLITWRRKMGLV
jgi:hypothetical protein